jgi:hypothetical protein
VFAIVARRLRRALGRETELDIGLLGDRQPTRDQLLVAASRAWSVRFHSTD